MKHHLFSAAMLIALSLTAGCSKETDELQAYVARYCAFDTTVGCYAAEHELKARSLDAFLVRARDPKERDAYIATHSKAAYRESVLAAKKRRLQLDVMRLAWWAEALAADQTFKPQHLAVSGPEEMLEQAQEAEQAWQAYAADLDKELQDVPEATGSHPANRDTLAMDASELDAAGSEEHMTLSPGAAAIAAEGAMTPQTTDVIQPSFDCSQASTPTEELICSNAALASLDTQLATRYAQLLAAYFDPSVLVEEQAQWLKKQRDTCDSIDCLTAAYQDRIKTLEMTLQRVAKPGSYR